MNKTKRNNGLANRKKHQKGILCMTHNSEFKPKAGYVYVVTNECLKPVKAKGIFRGRMVKAVKIGSIVL